MQTFPICDKLINCFLIYKSAYWLVKDPGQHVEVFMEASCVGEWETERMVLIREPKLLSPLLTGRTYAPSFS